jgi:hypothetical protein
VSGVELLNYLKKSLGIIIKRMEESGVVSLPSFTDHSFVELEVDDAGVSLSLPGMVFKVRNVGDAPVLVNLDRPVTDAEHLRVWPGTYRVIPRISGTIYLRAPAGYRTNVELEVLKA